MTDEDVSSKEELGLVNLAMENDYMPKSDDITRLDKINALEIFGARFILFHGQDVKQFQNGIRLWRRALTLRMMDTDDDPPIYKTPLKSKSGQLSEWSTLVDLQRIELEPSHCKIQALLVLLRFYSSISWSALRHHFIGKFLGFVVKEDLKSEILDVTWSTLKAIQLLERPYERSVLEFVFEIGRVLFFKFDWLPKDDPILNSENLSKFVELLLMTDPFHMIDPRFETPVIDTQQMNLLVSMFLVLSHHPELITNETRLTLIQLLHRDARDPSGLNLLLTACRYVPEEQGSALPTIRFLVKLGANLNAANNVGDGVLHLLAQEPGSETRDATARLLLELGAHLDMVNNARMTPADLWFQKNTPEKRDVAHLPDWLKEGVPKLMCLSSRVIRRLQMPYDDEAILPASLIPFVTLH